jgi:hypothetical protein
MTFMLNDPNSHPIPDPQTPIVTDVPEQLPPLEAPTIIPEPVTDPDDG